MTSRRGFLRLALAALALGPATRGKAAGLPDPDPRLMAAADRFALAHVLTGDADIDRATAAGLEGLSRELAARSTVEPGPPVAVDLDRDDLSLLELLYWPVTDTQPLPGQAAWGRLNRFLASGGMILFDTRDGDIAGTGAPDRNPALRALAAPLDIPPLAPLAEGHVLTRSFYLMGGLPGRYDAAVWVEAPPPRLPGGEGAGRVNDGVSPVVIGGNAWAEAWAGDEFGRPLFNLGRGARADERREMAIRAGINLVMYALTGNYKADQVHVPALLERLGRRGEAAVPRVPDGGWTGGAGAGGGEAGGGGVDGLWLPDLDLLPGGAR